jgi:hypothetical protein
VIAWVVFVICVAVLLMIGVERLIARLGIRRVEDGDTAGGLEAVVERLQRWADERERR